MQRAPAFLVRRVDEQSRLEEEGDDLVVAGEDFLQEILLREHHVFFRELLAGLLGVAAGRRRNYKNDRCQEEGETKPTRLHEFPRITLNFIAARRSRAAPGRRRRASRGRCPESLR